VEMWKKTILVFKIKVLDYSSNILCLLRVQTVSLSWNMT